MTLSLFNVLACVFSAVAFVTMILMFLSIKIGLKKSHIVDNKPNVTIDKFALNKKWRRIGMVLRLIMFLSFIAALGCILYYSILNKQALDRGAYDDIQKTQTLDELKESIDKGFIESKDIPDDVSGKIVIVFKYGCKDCNAIHDTLMDYLKKNNIEDVYFVSSRSEAGKRILYPYEDKSKCIIDRVPSIIYFTKNPKNDTNICYNQPLYDYDLSHKIYCTTDAVDTCVKLREEGL